MSKQASSRAGGFILLEFTKALLRNTESYKVSFMQRGVREILSYHKQLELLELKDRSNISSDVKMIVREKIKKDSEVVDDLRAEISVESSSEYSLGLFDLPEVALPETVRDVRPVPRFEKINLGRLNRFLNDPFVKVIECSGPDQKINVVRVIGHKSTSTSLSKEEIDEILMTFSRLGRIPLKPGVFRVVFGNLVLSALVSEIVGSKFMIKKIPMSTRSFRR